MKSPKNYLLSLKLNMISFKRNCSILSSLFFCGMQKENFEEEKFFIFGELAYYYII